MASSESRSPLQPNTGHWLMPAVCWSKWKSICLWYIGISVYRYIGISRYSVSVFGIGITVSRYQWYHGINVRIWTFFLLLCYCYCCFFAITKKSEWLPLGGVFELLLFFSTIFRFFLLLSLCCADKNWVNWVDTKLDKVFVITLIPEPDHCQYQITRYDTLFFVVVIVIVLISPISPIFT